MEHMFTMEHLGEKTLVKAYDRINKDALCQALIVRCGKLLKSIRSKFLEFSLCKSKRMQVRVFFLELKVV